MKCSVCNKEFDGNICPRCKFPKVFVPGNSESGMKRLQAEIDAYREEFLGGIEVSVVIYRWKDENGTLVPSSEERLSLGTAKELLNSARCLETLFARIPDEETVNVRILIKAGDEEQEKTVSIPNLPEAELQKIGICMAEDYSFKLFLSNDSGNKAESDRVPIFE